MQLSGILEYTFGKLLELITTRTVLKVVYMITQLFFIKVCHQTKMAYFVPCPKEITAKEPSDLFKSDCYRLHGVSKVIVSDRDPKLVGKF